MLSDNQILHALRWRGLQISGFAINRLQAASYDMTLDHQLKMLKMNDVPLDPKQDNAGEYESVTIGRDGFVLQPNDFVLGSTCESVEIGNQLKGRLEGKSSLGRLGLEIHRTAGYIDPGFTGHITLEMSCRRPIILWPGMPIAQLALYNCASVDRPYDGKYNGQTGPTVSRYHANWNGEEWI